MQPKNLTVVTYTGTDLVLPSAVQVQFQVWVNSVSANLACTVTLSAVPQRVNCSDNVDTVSVSAGDLVAVSMNPLGSIPSQYSDHAGLVMTASLEKQ